MNIVRKSDSEIHKRNCKKSLQKSYAKSCAW